MRKAYQSDLSDAEWSCLKPHLPVPEAHGRPRLHTLREVLDAIFYIVRGGCAWRLRLAAVAPRLPSLEDRLPLLPLLASGWHLGEDALSPTQARTGAHGPRSRAERLKWWTASRSRPPAWAEKSAVTMGPRRSRGANAIYWWTRRDWCSKRGSTAQRWWIGTASSFC